MDVNIESLEYHYQSLFADFQVGKIDEAMFTAEVDKLQFQDDWGRYWMLGSQTGSWHYYDGQNWHQADPRDADKLPFMDEQGRYWQQGTQSGDWYYHQPETDEWVKPSEDDNPFQPTLPQPGYGQPSLAEQAAYAPQQPQYAEPAGDPAAQFGSELFQDDDGRYWAMGAKSGQWYFYDDQGWHSAEEFQQPTPYQAQPAVAYTAPQQQAAYQPQPVYADGVSQQSFYQQTPVGQPAQAYTAPPQTIREGGNSGYNVNPQPAQDTPVPPPGSSQSGAWFYFDNDKNQWLKYSTGEPAETPPPDTNSIAEQEAKPVQDSANEPVVAEFFEDDEAPIEVVDVEVITVVEAEPDIYDEPEPEPVSMPMPAPAPAPVKSTVDPDLTRYTQPSADEFRPRRTKTSESVASDVAPTPAPKRSTKKRTPTDPVRPVTPRKKSAVHEPTIIIPTGATATGTTSSAAARVNRPKKQRTQSEQRRARDVTMPMAPIPLAGDGSAPDAAAPRSLRTTTPTPMLAAGRHRQVTQAALPVATSTDVGPTPVNRTESKSVKVSKRARQVTEDIPASSAPTPVPASQATQSKKEGYTFGEVLRSFPSTFWTLMAGVAILILFAVVIFIGATLFPGDDPLSVGGIAVAQSPTPTLESPLPDATPTLGVTPTPPPDVVNTPGPVTEVEYSNPTLGFSLEHPDTWQNVEDTTQTIFSPSAAGLNPDQFSDANIRIGVSADSNVDESDLLADVLTQFPLDAETLNEGNISIASQTWTSTQIRFEDENLAGQGIATIAVTNKDDTGYFLVAVAPSADWNTMQPLFQGVINSFRFISIVAQAQSSNPAATVETEADTTEELDEVEEETDTSGEAASTEEAVASASEAPATPSATTPVVHIVVSGDTLLAIAVQYGVDVDLLASENGITDTGSLSLGQELTIPFTAAELAEFRSENGGATSFASTSTDTTDNETSGSKVTESVSDDTSTTAPAEEAEAVVEEDTVEEEVPEAAPVSGKIVYSAFDPGRNIYDVWMVDLGTGEQTPLVGDASQPAFNKDGSLLAYRSWDRGTRGIFFRDFIGGRGGKVSNYGEDALPAWSPDGYTFAFASRKEGDRVARIYIGNQQGDESFGLAFQGEYPSTFPDGKIVAKGCTPTGDCGIFTMGPSGGGEKKISGDGGDTAPAPAPDGSKVAFMSFGRGANNWEIWVMNADGSNPVRLTENGSNDGLPAWSPDGQSIAYVSDQGGVWGIWVMNADGSNPRKVVDMKGSPDGKVLHDESNSRGWLEERISWAP